MMELGSGNGNDRGGDEKRWEENGGEWSENKRNKGRIEGKRRENKGNREEIKRDKKENIIWFNFKSCELDLPTGLLGSWLSIP